MTYYSLSTYEQRLREYGFLRTDCSAADAAGPGCGSGSGPSADCGEKIITGLTYDSRAVSEGTLFICKGATFKEDYLLSAQEKGAAAYVSETVYASASIPCLAVTDVRAAMPVLADLFFNSPAKELKLTGITGTKGKSTTAYYFKAIADDYLAARDLPASGITSSIDIYDGVINEVSHLTTPESVELMQHFRNARNSGIDYFTMEVSSQALKYNRVDLVDFTVGIFLNISEDHISPIEHPDFEDYFSSKLRLFTQTDTALICTDSDYYDRIADAAKASRRVITFGTQEGSDIFGYNIRKEGDGIHFSVRCDRFDREFLLTMPGLFNVENALAAIAAAYVYEIPEEFIYSGIARARSRGRMESYVSADGRIRSIVDFAHNKLSFEKIFASTLAEYPDYEIVTVFGCPGGKAYKRREDMGTIAGKYSAKVFIVADDPGEEPVPQISAEIAKYVGAQNCPYEMIEDRGEAIAKAIRGFEGRMILLVLGKGDDLFIKYGREYLDYPSDGFYVRKYLDEYNASHPA